MDGATWIAIYMPLFVLFFVILPQQQERKRVLFKRKKGVKNMINEIIKKYIGKRCKISTGPFGTNIKGRIIVVNENWIEMETKKGIELINAEYIQSIKINI